MYKTKDEKRLEHMAVGLGIGAAAAIVGGVALLEYSHNKKEQKPAMPIEEQHPAEKSSTAKLNEFTAANNIQIKK